MFPPEILRGRIHKDVSIASKSRHFNKFSITSIVAIGFIKCSAYFWSERLIIAGIEPQRRNACSCAISGQCFNQASFITKRFTINGPPASIKIDYSLNAGRINRAGCQNRFLRRGPRFLIASNAASMSLVLFSPVSLCRGCLQEPPEYSAPPVLFPQNGNSSITVACKG